MSDKKQWVAVDTFLTAKGLPRKLWATFGAFGVVVWVALLGAAKRNAREGTFEFCSPQDAFAQMGIPPEYVPDDFDLDEFFRLTGAKKETRLRRDGAITKVDITRWGPWQKTTKRRSRDAKDSDKTAGHTTDFSGLTVTVTDTVTSTTPRALMDPMKNALANACYPGRDRGTTKSGADVPTLTPGEWNAINQPAKDIISMQGTPEQVPAVVRRHAQEWPDITPTPTSVAKHWIRFSTDKPEQKNPHERGEGWGLGE